MVEGVVHPEEWKAQVAEELRGAIFFFFHSLPPFELVVLEPGTPPGA
jgi:hypothetical protein